VEAAGGPDPEQFVRCVPFRYISDALTPDEALEIVRRNEPTKGQREAYLTRMATPAYTTASGWLGYSDEHACDGSARGCSQGWSTSNRRWAATSR